MKPKKVAKKLNFRKVTVSSLNNGQMYDVKGGTYDSAPDCGCMSFDTQVTDCEACPTGTCNTYCGTCGNLTNTCIACYTDYGTCQTYCTCTGNPMICVDC